MQDWDFSIYQYIAYFIISIVVIGISFLFRKRYVIKKIIFLIGIILLLYSLFAICYYAALARDRERHLLNTGN